MRFAAVCSILTFFLVGGCVSSAMPGSAPITMQLLLETTFNEASLSDWQPIFGNWARCENGFCPNNATGGITLYHTSPGRNQDIQTVVTLDSATGGVALLGRASSEAETYYQFEIREFEGRKIWIIHKKEQESFTTLVSGQFEFPIGRPFAMRFRLEEFTLSAYVANTTTPTIDWQLLGSVEDDTLTTGKIGLKALNEDVTFLQLSLFGEAFEDEDTNFYVAPWGNDQDQGTFSSPFATIQRCAEVASAGQSCIIRAGIYRETVRPANSGTAAQPIVFRSYSGEHAVISGTDLISGWERYADRMYTTIAPWTLELGDNQLFVNGQMWHKARWPDGTRDPSLPVRARVEAVSREGRTWTIEAANIPAGLAGAKINVGVGENNHSWINQTGTVISSESGRLRFNSDEELVHPLLVDNSFYIWNHTRLLTEPGEWLLHEGQIYLMHDGPITDLQVEFKRRTHGFDLKERSHITVQDLELFATNIVTNNQSRNVRLERLLVSFPSHFTEIRGDAWTRGVGDTGIILHGENHLLTDSIIRYSAGNGVTLHGAGHRVINNIIHDVNYAGTDAAAVTTGCLPCQGLSSGLEIVHNTLFNAGRSILVHRRTANTRILLNHMYNAGLQSDDNGITYTFRNDGQGTEIAYNLLHDNLSEHLGLGIYLDNDSENFIVHHNVVFNVHEGIRLNPPSVNIMVFHNTALARQTSIDATGPREPISGIKIFNNIAPQGIRSPFNHEGNITTDTPGFIDANARDFRLRSDSPAVNAGIILSPFTDGFSGSAPDAGAFDLEDNGWRVGSSLMENYRPD
jgi:hypothetical protein